MRDKVEKAKSFWRSYKKAVLLVAALAGAGPFLPVLVPVLDAIAEAPAMEQAGKVN